jgi:hypothetical protein
LQIEFVRTWGGFQETGFVPFEKRMMDFGDGAEVTEQTIVEPTSGISDPEDRRSFFDYLDFDQNVEQTERIHRSK